MPTCYINLMFLSSHCISYLMDVLYWNTRVKLLRSIHILSLFCMNGCNPPTVARCRRGNYQGSTGQRARKLLWPLSHHPRHLHRHHRRFHNRRIHHQSMIVIRISGLSLSTSSFLTTLYFPVYLLGENKYFLPNPLRQIFVHHILSRRIFLRHIVSGHADSAD